MFFLERHRPVPPKPHEYTAVRDYGFEEPRGSAASVEGRRVDGQDVATRNVVTTETPSRERQSIAVIGDCSLFASGDMRGRVRPEMLMDRLQPDDQIAFGAVSSRAIVSMNWKKVSEAKGTAPKDFAVGDGSYNGNAPVDPYLDLMRDPVCQNTRRTAVLIGDLTGNNEGAHMLYMAERLAAEGVRIIVIAYTEEPLPDIEEVARKSGGQIVRTQDPSTIGLSLSTIQEPITITKTAYQLAVHFSSPQTYQIGSSVEFLVGSQRRTFKVASSP